MTETLDFALGRRFLQQRDSLAEADFSDVKRRAALYKVANPAPPRRRQRRTLVLAIAAGLILVGTASALAYDLLGSAPTPGDQAVTAQVGGNAFSEAFTRYASLMERAGVGELAFFPTDTPPGYRLYSAGIGSAGLTFELVDPENGASLIFRVRYDVTAGPCSAGSATTMRANGSVVYLKPADAWRCVPLAGGRAARIDASSSGISLESLAAIVGSAQAADG